MMSTSSLAVVFTKKKIGLFDNELFCLHIEHERRVRDCGFLI